MITTETDGNVGTGDRHNNVAELNHLYGTTWRYLDIVLLASLLSETHN